MSVSVVGFDVGNSTSFIAVARGGGIETIDNEYSDRCTPTFVSFGESSRTMGAAAKQQCITNLKNTVSNFPRLIGKMYDDPLVQAELKRVPYKVKKMSDGKVGIEVTYLRESTILTPEQVMAIQLTKLKDITQTHLHSPCIDVVINVPNYFTDSERRAMLDASRIANLNCVRLVNDTTACGVAYGLYNKDIPDTDKPPRNVAFVLMGQSNLQVAICAFNKGKMKVLSSVGQPSLGGRDFDEAIFKRLCEDIKARYKLDVSSSPKATIRLLQECEKLKKLMSANSTKLPLNIECFMEDKDISCYMQRSEFEEIISDHLKKFKETLIQCLELSKLKLEDVAFVELVGGSTRVPAIKSIVMSVFGKEGRTTLNADEAVARGCALQAAICSPAFKVKEFSVVDVCQYPITLQWENDAAASVSSHDDEKQNADEDKLAVSQGQSSVEVFPRLFSVPASRQIELQRASDFAITAKYSHPEMLPNQNAVIGAFAIRQVKPQPGQTTAKVRVKVRINSHGIFTISHAQQGEKHEKQVEVEPEPEGKPAAMDVDQESENAGKDQKKMEQETAAKEESAKQPPKKTTTKLVTRYRDLAVEAKTLQLSDKEVMEYAERENAMIQQDKLERDRSNAKNALEEYIYELRDKLSTCLEKFVLEKDREQFSAELTKMEDWLYEEGEDVPKAAYVERLSSLKNVGDRYLTRFREFEMRPAAIDHFGRVANRIEKALASYTSGEETYAHLTKDEMEQVSAQLKEHKAWYEHNSNAQNAKKPHEDPVMLAQDVLNHADNLENATHRILNKPKPAKEPPAPPTQTEANGPTEANGESNNNDMETDGKEKKEEDQAPKKNVAQEGDKKSAGEAECMDLD